MQTRTQPFQLRPSLATDHDEIARVWHGSASLPGVGPAVMPSLDELRQRVDVEVATGWSVTVAIREGVLIGFVALRATEAVLNELFVEPPSIGAGVGRALLDRAKTLMPKGFCLHTRPGNARARHFYEKSGLIFLRDDTHPKTGEPMACYGWNKA